MRNARALPGRDGHFRSRTCRRSLQLPTGERRSARRWRRATSYVVRPDGALPPEADASAGSRRAGRRRSRPSSTRIRRASRLRSTRAAPRSISRSVRPSPRPTPPPPPSAVVGRRRLRRHISGASGEELAKPMSRASQLRGPPDHQQQLAPATPSSPARSTCPLGVTLWIDKGVTVFADPRCHRLLAWRRRTLLCKHRGERVEGRQLAATAPR